MINVLDNIIYLLDVLYVFDVLDFLYVLGILDLLDILLNLLRITIRQSRDFHI